MLDGVRSLLVLGSRIVPLSRSRSGPAKGAISRYAWGGDYHDVIPSGCKGLIAWLQQREPAAPPRGVVDTAPLLEREFAQLAGLGWIGKNTLLLNKHAGSYFFLAALLTDRGTGLRRAARHRPLRHLPGVLDACPTEAFVAAVCARRHACISYLTIELQRPDSARSCAPGCGDWLFGCDVCQDVCPWNHRPRLTERACSPASGREPH